MSVKTVAAVATEVMRMGSEIIQMQSAKERYRTEHRTDHRKETAPEEVRYQTTKMQKEQILRQLKDQGCRITKQRLTLLDIILEEDCSCCKEIYYKASVKDPGIGMATVYRMVNMLERIGAISRKNMYRISCEEGCKNQSCRIEFSDHTVCSFTPGMWTDIVRAGLQACGYIKDGDQEIENIVMLAAE